MHTALSTQPILRKHASNGLDWGWVGPRQDRQKCPLIIAFMHSVICSLPHSSATPGDHAEYAGPWSRTRCQLSFICVDVGHDLGVCIVTCIAQMRKQSHRKLDELSRSPSWWGSSAVTNAVNILCLYSALSKVRIQFCWMPECAQAHWAPRGQVPGSR